MDCWKPQSQPAVPILLQWGTPMQLSILLGFFMLLQPSTLLWLRLPLGGSKLLALQQPGCMPLQQRHGGIDICWWPLCSCLRSRLVPCNPAGPELPQMQAQVGIRVSVPAHRGPGEVSKAACA